MNRYLALALVISLAINAGLIYIHLQKQNVEYVGSVDSNLVGVVYPVLEITIVDSSNNTVYRYTKVGDPPTRNFLLGILNSYWYSTTNKEMSIPSWTAETGTSGTPYSGATHGATQTTVSGVSYVSMKIAIGTDTTPPSINDYKLGNKIAEFPVYKYVFGYNATHMWIYLGGVYTATSQITFQEIGLFAYYYLSIGSSSYWFLLFRDVLPSPITLNQGNSMIVGYYIYVRYA